MTYGVVVWIVIRERLVPAEAIGERTGRHHAKHQDSGGRNSADASSHKSSLAHERPVSSACRHVWTGWDWGETSLIV